MVEGDADHTWGVFVRDTVRIGLFSSQYMGEDAWSLNFRGADIPRIVEHLESCDVHPIAKPTIVGSSSGSARFRDPDGNLIFFDSAVVEVKLVP